MQSTNVKHEQLEQDLRDDINACRGRVLDVVEAQIGATSNWRVIRGQLLNLFGERGLSGDIQRELIAALGGESNEKHG